MHIISRDERYFILRDDGKFFQVNNYQGLLNWFKTGYYSRRIQLDGCPFEVDLVGHHKNEVCKYIVFDSMNRVINAKILANDVKELEKHEDRERENRSNKKHKYIYRRVRKNWLGFRNGPVPYTGYGNKARRCGSKSISVIQEIRRNSWDYKYTRARRSKKYLPRRWYRSKNAYKSWKSQKKRKQWM